MRENKRIKILKFYGVPTRSAIPDEYFYVIVIVILVKMNSSFFIY